MSKEAMLKRRILPFECTPNQRESQVRFCAPGCVNSDSVALIDTGARAQDRWVRNKRVSVRATKMGIDRSCGEFFNIGKGPTVPVLYQCCAGAVSVPGRCRTGAKSNTHDHHVEGDPDGKREKGVRNRVA